MARGRWIRKDDVTLIVSVCMAAALLIALGWIGHIGYMQITEEPETQRELDGLWLKNYDNYSHAKEYAQTRDRGGDWICVNIRNMSIRKAIETCTHEAGHEIYAEHFEEKQILNWTQ